MVGQHDPLPDFTGSAHNHSPTIGGGPYGAVVGLVPLAQCLMLGESVHSPVDGLVMPLIGANGAGRVHETRAGGVAAMQERLHELVAE